MFEFFANIFSPDGFPARWNCGKWSAPHGWLHIISDLAIFAAYMAIPVVLGVLASRRKDIPFPKTIWLFVAFIGCCGVGHLLEAVIFWHPVYRLSGVLKGLTAVASWATVVALVPTAKQALTLRSAADVEREKAKLQSVLANLSAGVALADAGGKLSLFNPAAEAILGLGSTDIESSEWSDYYGLFEKDGETRCAEEDLPLVQVLSGASEARRTLIIRKPGAALDCVIDVSARPMIDEETKERGAIASFTDITERTLAEQELERSNRDLEQFAFAASHDLKEPLRQIQTYGGLLMDRYADVFDEDGKRHFGYMTEGAERAALLVQGLLDYSQAGGNMSEAVDVDIGKLMKDVVSDLSLTIDENEAKVEVVALPVVHAQLSPLRQIFQNLVQNALKFHGEAPLQVRVSHELAPREHVFCVADNGIGIAEEHHEKIFQVFQRLHTRAEFAGTGIGLALCQRIVRGWGGRMWLESEVGKGTKFFFTVRRTPADASAA